MAGEVYDVSFAHAGLGADLLVRSGAAGVIGYLSADPRKNMTRADVDRWHGAGLAVAAVHENTADWHTWDPAGANALAALLGLPDWRPIYYAVDTDVDPGDHAEIADRLAAMPGRPRGIYGPSALVEYCLDRGAAGWGWLTAATAWDPGPAPRACLRQLAGRSPLPGTDQNIVQSTDWGQWPAEGGTVAPQPATMVTRKGGPMDPHHGEVWLAEGVTATWVPDEAAVTRNQFLGIGGPVEIDAGWFDSLALLPTPSSIAARVSTSVAARP